jgi:hypothetical protein
VRQEEHDIGDIAAVVLETDGFFSVVPKKSTGEAVADEVKRDRPIHNRGGLVLRRRLLSRFTPNSDSHRPGICVPRSDWPAVSGVRYKATAPTAQAAIMT